MKVAVQKLAFIVVAVAAFIGIALGLRWLANTYWRPVLVDFSNWIETTYGAAGIYLTGTAFVIFFASLLYLGIRSTRRYR